MDVSVRLTLNVQGSTPLVRRQDLVPIKLSGLLRRNACEALLFVDQASINLPISR